MCSQTSGTEQQTFLPNSRLERGAVSFSSQKTLGEHEAGNQSLSGRLETTYWIQSERKEAEEEVEEVEEGRQWQEVTPP